MKVVVYTEQLVPLTVVELSEAAVAALRVGRSYILAAVETPESLYSGGFAEPIPDGLFAHDVELRGVELRGVELRGVRIRWRQVDTVLVTVRPEQEAHVLLLHAAFLPGQIADIRRETNPIFLNSFFYGLLKGDVSD